MSASADRPGRDFAQAKLEPTHERVKKVLVSSSEREGGERS